MTRRLTVYCPADEEVEVSVSQIVALASEAGAAGDLAMVAICRRALDGDDTAHAECARVIAYAAAQG